MVHPIKDYVDYLGGYFNDDGVNMMHENFIGGPLSTGTQLVFDICCQHAPDFSILLHGGDNCHNHILYPAYASMKTKQEVLNVVEAVAARSEKEGVRYTRTAISRAEDNVSAVPSFNLISAMHHCCSEPAVTYESNQGLIEHRDPVYDYDEIYAAHIILFTETIREQLKRYNKI
jgi:hypothetical protein